ncbi:hypothetical protein [Roseibium sp.]|uniref:hypothetical protein n=1 Tax=Roseibium sp. TaxID=1936156 RepID=UPI003D09A613
MYNPREAAEDGHALNLALLFFVACAVVISVYFHYDSGLKYWLLKGFGQTAEGTILNIQGAPSDLDEQLKTARQSPRNSLKNFEDWVDGKILVVEFATPDALPKIVSFRIPKKFTGNVVSGRISITYLPLNPRIAYPTEYLEDFAFDSKVLQWSLLTGLVVILYGTLSALKWSRFRGRMRKY